MKYWASPLLTAAAVVFCYLLGLTVWVHYSWIEHRELERNDYAVAENTVRLLEEHVKRRYDAGERIEAASFERLYRSLALPPNAVLSIFREDGAILARFSEKDSPASEADQHLFKSRLSQNPAGTYEAVSSRDGLARIVSYRKVDGLPLVVAVAQDTNLHRWSERVVVGGAFALAILGSVTMLARLSMGGWKREEKALRALRRSEERFRTALEMSMDGFVILRPIFGEDGRVRDFQPLYANSATLRRCGLTESNIHGKTVLDLFPDAAAPDGFLDSYIAVAETGAAHDSVRRIDTARLAGWFRTKILKINDGIAVSFEDVGDQVLAEQELTAARRKAEMANRAKSRFLASASHDLRQPFQAMELYHHLLMTLLTDKRHQDVAQRLGEAMDAGQELLNALLDISTLEAGTLQPKVSTFPIQTILDHLTQELGPQIAGKGLRLTMMPSSAMVHSDPVLLERLLRNLMTNALRYTEQGRILVGCRRHAGYLVIEVWDTGPGIPDDRLEIIFEDFYQLGNPERDRRRGLGLGLSIVKRTADILGHAVIVRSEPNKGSVFAIGVPLVRHPPPQPSEEMPAVALGSSPGAT